MASHECMKPELDLFSEQPLQTSIEHGQWIEYSPLAALNQGGPIELNIDGAGNENIDLFNTYCYQEVPGSLPGWGIMIFFSSQGKQTVRAIYCHCDNLSHTVMLKQKLFKKVAHPYLRMHLLPP